MTSKPWKFRGFIIIRLPPMPYKFIRMFFPGFAPKKGDYMTGNAFTTGDCCKVPHDLSWNLIDPSVYNPFHNPKAFGRLWFG